MSTLMTWPDTFEETYGAMRAKLGQLMPDAEIRAKAEVACEVNRLKRRRGAVILGHNYMEPALYHSVPDFRGDSLELSRVAATTTGDPIIFCGVRFMAETAKILNPGKTVLIPSPRAGCSLAASVTAADVRRLREEFPGVPVVTYVNTYAEVKAESDICCTSGNAARVVASLPGERVIFLPDEYLARNVARETGKKIIVPRVIPGNGAGVRGAGTAPGPAGEVTPHTMEPVRQAAEEAGAAIVGWPGRCEVHERFTVEDVSAVRRQLPDVLVLAHPECSPEVVEASDFSGSTTAMIRYVREHPGRRYLLLTECSMADNIVAENPASEMVGLCSIRCPHMNEITLEDTLESLRRDRYVVEVPEEIRVRALRAVERMLAIG